MHEGPRSGPSHTTNSLPPDSSGIGLNDRLWNKARDYTPESSVQYDGSNTHDADWLSSKPPIKTRGSR